MKIKPILYYICTGETIDREEGIGAIRDGTAGADGEEIIEEIGTLLFLPTIGM